jgi:hypothetical protein
VPFDVVTATSTAPAAWAAVVAVIVVALTTVMPVGAVPPKVTAVAPVNAVPVRVTAVPPAIGPPFGALVLTVGGVGAPVQLPVEDTPIPAELIVTVRSNCKAVSV